MPTNLLYNELKLYFHDLEEASKNGDILAIQVFELYEMHRMFPNDPAALSLCQAYFDEWKHSRIDA